MFIYQNFRDRFVEIAGSRSLFNTQMNAAMFMSVIGAAMMKRGLLIQHTTLYDLRLHLLWIQASRTGKGVSMNVAEDFATGLGLTMAKELQFTDAGVVGTIDPNAVKINKKSGFLPGDPDYVNPMVIGDLGLFDIVAFTEAKQMFKTGTHTEDKLEILQTVMDVPKPRSYNVRKKLGLELPVQYNSTATIIGTTYFLEEFAEILLKQGLFQRLYTGVRDVTWKEREKINHALLFPPVDILPYNKYTSSMENLCNEIIEAINIYDTDSRLSISEAGLKGLDYLNKERMKYVKNTISGTELEIVEPFLTAMVPMNIKLAGQRAILNGASSIRYEDVKDTRDDMMFYLKSVINHIMTRVNAINLEATRRWILGVLEASGTITREEMISKMTKKVFASKKRCDVILNDLIKNKTLIEKDGILRINRKV